MPIYSDDERERHNTVTGMLQGESDRGAVLIGAAFLDDLLEELLAAVFIDPTLLRSPKERERFGSLFGHGGPAGGFSNRINLAYALGLISKRDHDDLHRVRDIRNDFAHKLQYTSFEDQSVSARCNGFAIVKDILDSGLAHSEGFDTPRRQYQWTISILYGRLVEQARMTQHRIVPASRRVEFLEGRPRFRGRPLAQINFGSDAEKLFVNVEDVSTQSTSNAEMPVEGFNE